MKKLARSAWMVAGLSLAGALGAMATSTSMPAPPPPAVVAVVNVQTVINGLKELKFQIDDAAKRTEARQKDVREAYDKAQSIKTELEMLPKDTPDKPLDALDAQRRLLKEATLIEAQQTAAAKKSIADDLAEYELGTVFGSLYDKTLRAVEDYSGRNGIDLVLLDDRTITVPIPAKKGQVEAVVQEKDVLFASGRIDITNDIIAQMNAEFDAGGKKK